MLRSLGLVFGVALAGTANAEDLSDPLSPFVTSNIIAIFHHEMGHALIDIVQIPIFGQEEDAADVFSIFMIDAIYDDDDAKDLAYDTAFGFLGEAQARDAEGEEIAWWGVHGVDEQRFYNTVCIFYGADPDGRTDFADEFELPEDRAEYCPSEYYAASMSWGGVLDQIATDEPSDTIQFVGDDAEAESALERILDEEVQFLNENFKLPRSLDVRVDACEEANAFYDPETVEIVFCKEFVEHLQEMETQLED